MKSKSGINLKEKFDFMKKAIYSRGGIWSRGYCAYTAGLNEKAIMDYVEYQYKEDIGQLELGLGE
ncbi:MAG: transposase [Actinobacteria bacterium]|nr:transposase [Actinomycetota bacterium]